MFFADRWLLWILGPLWLVWALFWTYRNWVARSSGGGVRSGALRFSSTRNLERLTPSWTVRMRLFTQALRLITVGLIVIALARPQTGKRQTQVSSEGIDIVLTVDTSDSMRALDLDADKPIAKRRERLQVVKDVILEFVKQRERDQIGMVVFGEEAYTQCPLTLDHGILATLLEQVQPGMAGSSTAIGSGLGTAINRLKKSAAKSKVVILLTDGRNNSGDLSPKKAAQIAKSLGIKVYTIGAGAKGPAPYIQDTLLGKTVVYQEQDLDEDLLQNIAQVTGAAYFRATDTSTLEDVYRRIDSLEKTEIKTQQYLEYNERYAWFVLPAVLLLLTEVALLGTRLRKIP